MVYDKAKIEQVNAYWAQYDKQHHRNNGRKRQQHNEFLCKQVAEMCLKQKQIWQAVNRKRKAAIGSVKRTRNTSTRSRPKSTTQSKNLLE